MKATCTYENIKKALRAVEGMVGKDVSIPIISNILIEAHEDMLWFSATNLEIGVVQKIPAKVDGRWKIVISPQLLAGFLNAIRGGEHITVIKDEDSLIVKNDSYESVIKGLDAEEFPIIPQVAGDGGVSLNLGKLKESISTVLPFVTHNEIRPELTGVFFKVADGKVYSVATDSFRLGERCQEMKHLLEGDADFSYQIILPQRICAYINKLGDEYDEVLWDINDNHLSVQCDQLYITTRLIDGNYPDYKQIIPEKTETNVIVKKDDLLESMRVMMVFSDKDVNEIVLGISEDSLSITTRKQERGTSETVLKASVSGDDQEIVVNPRYVFEGIQGIKEDEVFIGVNSSAAPIVFRGSSTDGVNVDYTYIVMPIKNNS